MFRNLKHSNALENQSFALKRDHFSLYENFAKTEDQLMSIIGNSQKHKKNN
jgi:hypothetical protein